MQGNFSEFAFVDLLNLFSSSTLAFHADGLRGEGEVVLYVHHGDVLNVTLDGRPRSDAQARDDIRLMMSRPNGTFALRRIPLGVINRRLRVNLTEVVLKTSAEFDEKRARKIPVRDRLLQEVALSQGSHRKPHQHASDSSSNHLGWFSSVLRRAGFKAQSLRS